MESHGGDTVTDTEQKKKYLKRYRKMVSLIARLEERVAKINARMLKVRSPNFSGEVQGTGKPVTIEEMISDKIELEERISKLEKKSKPIKHEIVEKIDSLDDPRHAEVLEAYFIDCKDFQTIADEIGYTKRHVIRLYSDAINKIRI